MSFSRVFVANRGEIALRIVRACRKLGLESVLGASEVDLEGPAARLADRVVCIGPAPAERSYLRHDTVVHAALGTGCDALHPGYGFLAENPELAAAALEHGLRFVGPPPEVMALAGDKLRARAAAAEAGLPVVPGREVATAADVHGFAEEWGYPVLLKAASGGGGRGIKLAGDAAELEALHSTAAAEARAAFGDERLYVERRIGDARHVEVQVAADNHGAVIHMGERDCSVQRRHQKLIEEAPAPFLTDPTGEAVREAGVEFFFLEMNCRIQVEHPVTEAVTGYDLVAKQLEIAAGEPLGMAQPDVAIAGHAVECRLTAEDVSHGFRPSPGRLTRFELPDVANLRVDTHCEEGTVIPPHYDSLMAKLIGFGAERDAAVDVLREALDGLRVEGVETNRELLASVLTHDDFARGAVTTRWLEEAVAA
jgi:acetyl-CoA carboxylase biotin carboxylase subunit